MKIALLILSLLLFAAWTYSGSRELTYVSMDGNEMTLSNSSRWLVHEVSRAKKWEQGDRIKLIEVPTLFPYNYLALNLTREDCVHVRCLEDAF